MATRTPPYLQAPSAAHLPSPVANQLTLYHGALDFDHELRHTMTTAIDATGESRVKIAGRISDLAAAEVTKAQLDAWTAPSRGKWNIPVKLAPAFDIATGSSCLLDLIARKTNHSVLSPNDAAFAELGRIERDLASLRERRAMLLTNLSLEGHSR